MAGLIEKKDNLNQGRLKLNRGIQDAEYAKNTANDANQKSEQAVVTADESKSQSTSTQDQLDTIVIESGTSDAETLQSRTNERGKTFDNLYQRINDLDIEFEERAVNVKWYGASGSKQSTTGDLLNGSNQLTVSDAIDFKVGQGILVEGAGTGGVQEVAELQITSAPSSAGQVIVTLDGIATNVDVDPAVETTAIAVADKIRNTTFAGWTTGGTAGTDTVTFTSDNAGSKQDATYNDNGTGALGTMTTTTQGQNGADLITEITAINGTTFTLVDSASTDVTSETVNHDDTDAIESAINSLREGDTLYFPSLSYRLTRRLTVTTSNIKFLMNGAEIIWDGPGLDNLGTGVFEFKGALSTSETTIAQNEPARTNTVTVTDGTIFNEGDYVYSTTPNGTEKQDIYNNYFSQIVQKNGNELSYLYEKRLGYTASLSPTITKVNAIKNITIEGGVFRANNQTTRDNGMGGLLFVYCDNITVKNCEFDGFWFKGVKTSYCTRVNLESVESYNHPATNGGEGYGVQFEYTNVIHLKGGSFKKARHGIDFSGSSHAVIEDVISNRCTNSSYTTHKMFEYNITFKNCHSYNDESGGFALGSVTGQFGDTSDDIFLENCKVIGFSSYAVQAAGKGKGYHFNNCEFKVIENGSASAVIVTNNNTNISNCNLEGAIQVSNITDAANDGFVKVRDSIVKQTPNNRAFKVLDDTSIQLDRVESIGTIQIGENCVLKVNGSNISTLDEFSLFNFYSTVANTKIYLNDSEILLSGSGMNYSLDSEIHFIGCNIQTNSPSNQMLAGINKIRFKNCEGFLRFISSGKIGVDIQLMDSVFDNQGVRILNILNTTGKINVLNNQLILSSNTANNLFIASSDGNDISGHFTGNDVVGVVDLTGMTQGIIKDNIFDGSNTLPTATSSLVVSDNV